MKNLKEIRRMNPQEYATELDVAKWMKRPPCQMIYDVPYYPWLTFEPLVNFDLKYKE